MRLTALLMHWKKKRPHGILYRGTNRVVLDPKKDDLARLVVDFERDERNMLILRHPYLTKEQNNGYMKELRMKDGLPLRRDDANELRNSIFSKNYTWVDQLRHLRVTDAWE